MHEPVATLKPQRLLPGKGHGDAVGQVVGHPGFDPQPLADEPRQLRQLEAAAREAKLAYGVVGHRLVDLAAHKRVFRCPRPGRVGSQLGPGSQPQANARHIIGRLKRHRRRLEAERDQRPPEPLADSLGHLAELRLGLLVDLAAGPAHDLAAHLTVGLLPHVVVLAAGDRADERAHDRHVVEARLDRGKLGVARGCAAGGSKRDPAGCQLDRLEDGEAGLAPRVDRHRARRRHRSRGHLTVDDKLEADLAGMRHEPNSR